MKREKTGQQKFASFLRRAFCKEKTGWDGLATIQQSLCVVAVMIQQTFSNESANRQRTESKRSAMGVNYRCRLDCRRARPPPFADNTVSLKKHFYKLNSR